MMVARLAPLAMVGACSFSPPEETASDAASDTPIDATACVAIGHDEDGDDVDDACDSCPDVAGATGDSDDDGIGDACDPDPASANDRRRDFITFAEADAQARWQVIGANWSWQVDELRFSDPTCCNYQVARDSRPPFEMPIAITALLVIDTAPSGRGHFGMLLNVNGPGNGGVACAIVRESDGDSVVFVNDPVGGVADNVALPAAIASGARYRLRFSYEPAIREATCAVEGGPAADIILSAPPPAGPLGFEAMGMVGRVEHAAIYGRD